MRRIFFLLILPILLVGCKVTEPLYRSTFSFDTVFVEEVDVPDTVVVHEAFSIRVKGNLPDPSWTFDHFELFTEDSTLTIRPIGQQDLSIEVAAQVLVPFDEVTSFRPIQTGQLRITVIGRTKMIEKKVIVVGND